MSIRSILLAGVLAILPVAAHAVDPELTKVRQEMLSPVVQLNRTCSGTVIQSNPEATLVLTAKHCVADTRKKTQDIYVPVYQLNRLVREDLYKAKVVSVSMDFDLALLRLTDSEASLPVARVAPADVPLVEGEAVWTVGWPAGLNRTITMGSFGNRADVAFPNPSEDSEYFRATPAITGGNSGGALFHKAEDGVYEQIGVTSAGRRDANFISYYVPVDQIQLFLSQQKVSLVVEEINKELKRRGTKGVTVKFKPDWKSS